MNLRDLLDERGLSYEDAAALLAEHGIVKGKGPSKGEPYSALDVSRRGSAPVTRSWLSVFGGSIDDGQSVGGHRPSDEPQPSRRARGGEPPTPPQDAKVVTPDLGVGARKRIAGAYKFAGAMLATGTGSEGVAHVWGDQSDAIADLWVQAAADNPYAARFVEIMNTGGAMGDVVAAHIYLVGGTLYVLGAAIPAGNTIFSKYEGYRAKPKPKPGASGGPGAAAGANGAGDPGQVPGPPPVASQGPVGHSPG